MKPLTAAMSFLLLASFLGAEQPSPARKASGPEALRTEIEALKPANHVWRAIAWKTCPLEALKESRDRKKPVIAWVFLGIPSDERC